MAALRLRWNGSIQAQEEADKAYQKLQNKKPKRPKKKSRRKRKSHRERCLQGLSAGKQETDYRAYINSSRWEARRKHFVRLARRRCQQCGRAGTMTVHHLHYRTLGMERPEDVRVLCWSCHAALHQEDRLAAQHLHAIAQET